MRECGGVGVGVGVGVCVCVTSRLADQWDWMVEALSGGAQCDPLPRVRRYRGATPVPSKLIHL